MKFQFQPPSLGKIQPSLLVLRVARQRVSHLQVRSPESIESFSLFFLFLTLLTLALWLETHMRRPGIYFMIFYKIQIDYVWTPPPTTVDHQSARKGRRGTGNDDDKGWGS
jgi:hypothetical protein